MGLANCRYCGGADKEESNSQVAFYTEELPVIEGAPLRGRAQKLSYLSTLKKPEFDKAKEFFDNNLKENGEYIVDKEIETIIEEINPLGNELKVPDDIIKNSSKEGFDAPPIRFNNGEIYKGWWNTNSQRNGYGINIKPDGCIYKGLWEEDNIGKYGIFVDKEGNYYQGELVDGKYQGKGKIEMKDKMIYEGDFENEVPNGQGILKNLIENTTYQGTLVKGMKEGKGTLEYEDGTKYEGDFQKDKFDGEGTITFSNGGTYTGQFKDNKITGKGVYKWPDGKKYEGEYDNFVKKGYGKFLWDEGKYYEGQWLNNKQHGKGVYHNEGQEVKGISRFGKIIMEDKENSTDI